MLAMVDANYNFLFVDVGCKGRISDGGVLRQSSIYNKLEINELNIPEPRLLSPNHAIKTPYMLLGDKAFALKPYCMRPYNTRNSPNGSSDRMFNTILSQNRQVVESTFGIWSGRFRVVRNTMLLQPEVTNRVVLATVYLHIFLRARAHTSYMSQTPGDNDQWSTVPLNRIPPQTTEGMTAVRDQLRDYFVQQMRR